MQNMAADRALLRPMPARQIPARQRPLFRTGLDAMDDLAPGGGLRSGAIHELLFDSPAPPPQFLALLLARAAQTAGGGVVVWSDPQRRLHPPAAVNAGLDPRRLILLRPRNPIQEISALAECLRCQGVSATVTSLNRLSDIESRRLQLAAENGGGIGIFLRPMTRASAANYAAATRWRVRPAPAQGDRQCWTIELLHGHGGRFGSTVLLEVDRETGDVRASASLADRPAATPHARATA
jgi:protein ImuA